MVGDAMNSTNSTSFGRVIPRHLTSYDSSSKKFSNNGGSNL